MSTQGPNDYAGGQHAFFVDGVSYQNVPVSAAWVNQPTSSPSSRHPTYSPAWIDANLNQDDAPKENMSIYPTSAAALQRTEPLRRAGSNIPQNAPSMNSYMHQWPYDESAFTETVTSQAFPRSVPMESNLDELSHVDPHAPHRRDSDSQWSQITSTNDSIASSMQDPIPPQHPSRPNNNNNNNNNNNRTSPPSESRKPKTWSTRPHSIIEKKYRENLNNKIWQLHQALVDTNRLACLKDAQQHATTTKISKSEIIANAVRYINEMELNSRHMEEQISRLMKKIKALEGGGTEEENPFEEDESTE